MRYAFVITFKQLSIYKELFHVKKMVIIKE